MAAPATVDAILAVSSAILTPERTALEVSAVQKWLDLKPDSPVLDPGCASEAGVEIALIRRDMRDMPPDDPAGPATRGPGISRRLADNATALGYSR